MAIIERDATKPAAQTRDLALEGGMVGLEKEKPAFLDFAIRWRATGKVERLAVKSRGRTEFGGRRAGIERGARWIAIDVDDGARNRRADDRRVEAADKIIEVFDAPVGVLAG